uniref:ANK_REP_REGION domain-containing protein n=1 Tax=Macrostomum lignano TaxID=282301 RepID=A0A1I8HZY0_9PLAT
DYKCTPLHIASQNGHHLVVKFLIRAQAEVDATDKDGASPLYYASQNGHERVVSLLIKAQADVNLSTNSGGSPLSIASEQNHFKVVQLLIKAQSDVNLQRETGSSPLYLACQNGHHQVARSLLKAEADVDLPNSVGASPLYIASQDGHHAAVSLLIKAGAHVNTQCDDGMSPLYVASLNNHLPVVKSLIKAHAKPLSDHIQIVDLLIKAQAVVDLSSSDNCTPLFAACFQGHSKVVSLLVRAMADVNIVKSDGCTPVFIAAQNGHNQVVDLLIKAQADLNCRCIEGCTPTFAASLNGHHKVVDSLIQAQADVSIPRMDGLTPLKAASLLKHHQVVTLLTLAEYHFEELELYWTEVELDDDSGSSAMDATDQEVPSTETELGEQLHAPSRAVVPQELPDVQAAAADVLQEILRNRIAYEDIFVVGSFSEGWGNSLTSLDWENWISSPTLTHKPSQAIPGLLAEAGSGYSCSLPSLLLPSHRAPSSVPAISFQHCSLDTAVTRERIDKLALSRGACCPPKKSGKQLRVSTTFLEKRLLRSLSTLQGQLFVTLKYLVKKVICRRVQGVKAYHVKTITFRMLEETPSDQWKPENLVSQIRRSLKILSSSVKSSCSEDEAATKPEDKIMNHFFLCDAALYLKGADKSSSQEISRVLQYVMKRLPELLIKFIHTLRPLTNTGTFHFHPFLILPRMKANKVRMSAAVEYHEIYDLVRESLVRLSQRDCCSPELKQSLLQHISQLPDCARTARETLKALAFLKFRDRDAALKVLADCRGHTVSEGISWRSERSAAEATKDLMWHYLWSNDSAWKFCFEFDQRPELEFLPAVLSDCFPLRLQNYVTYHYVNFDAFLHSLRLELTPQDEDAHRWVNTVALRVGADIQELVVGASFCREPKLLIEPWRDLQAALAVIPRRLADEVAQRLKVFDRGEQEMSSDSADATVMHVHVL